MNIDQPDEPRGATESNKETFEEACARLGIEIDTETSGSEIIFAGKRLAEKLQAQAGTSEKHSDT